jgi:hypothetical protein
MDSMAGPMGIGIGYGLGEGAEAGCRLMQKV